MGQSPSGRNETGDDIQVFNDFAEMMEGSSPEVRQKKNFLLKLFKPTTLTPTTSATLRAFTSNLSDSTKTQSSESSTMRTSFDNVQQDTSNDSLEDEEYQLTSIGSFVRKEKRTEPLIPRSLKDYKKFKHFYKITCIKVENNRIWTSSLDKNICCWDKETGECIKLFQGHTKAVTCLKIDMKNNLLYSGSYDRTVRVWDIETQTCKQVFDSNENWITCLAVSSDYLFCSGYDSSISVYELKTGKKIAKLNGHVKKVEDMFYEHSEGILYTSGADCTVRMWDISSLECIKVHSCREYSHYFYKVGSNIYISQPQNIYSYNTETNKVNPPIVGITQFCIFEIDEDSSYIVGWNKDKRQFEFYDTYEITLVHTIPQETILDASNLSVDAKTKKLYFSSGMFVKFIDISSVFSLNLKNGASRPAYMNYEELFNYLVDILFYPVTKVAEVIEDLQKHKYLDECKTLDDQIEKTIKYLKQQQDDESLGSDVDIIEDIYYITKNNEVRLVKDNQDLSDRNIYFELSIVPNTVQTIEERLKAISTLSMTPIGAVESFSCIYTDDEREMDYETRKDLFYKKLKALKGDGLLQPTVVMVRRDQLVFDACKNFSVLKGADLLRPMFVYFAGEEGFDVGGVTREFYHLLSQQILNPNNALFIKTGPNNTYHPNPASAVNGDHLQYFQFIGKLIGKAISDNKIMDTHFTKVIFKLMAGKPVMFEDLEAVDPTMYLSLKKLLLLEDIENIMEMTFTADLNDFGENNVYELCFNGAEIEVNDGNKHEFVEAYSKWKLVESVRPQVEKMLEGIYEVLPPEFLTIFSETELELLLCGSREVSISQWKDNISYEGGFDTDHPTVQYFWEMIEGYSQTQIAQLLQFSTGTSCLPSDGFEGLTPPFTLCLLRNVSTDHLPVAHTCLNRIDIPPYESKEIMKERFGKAIRYGSQGFSLH
ncbi:HECT domain-containing ubiquitin ligase [Naegleria gruberi]|uniref:HECT-type E3 ubiquitin transferase n=1 Tax=Naegleria gruberi TaxID=5762 RepID=D2VVA3_NAEGR|nr:HECT domain-containing ubiquitin ligase [Naegleria gruberi]EFC39276.1 HECT domain-containing ubiquitin ligase [Naegleria gruberi]|eukprot:XP_002672020.1 HECT domain-containing ubiquitin ligase [Naegleria gruberi strain NEG-M]